MPAYDVYTLRGLYLAPDDSVQVSLAGTELPVAAERTEFDVQCTAKFPPSENSSLSARAMDFAKAYITYTGQGFNNTDQHLADVLSYVIKNTDTYKRIENSKIAFIYVTPVLSSKYNSLEVTSVTQYNDTLCACTVEFDVQQNTYGHLRDYVGTFHLIFTEIDGRWMIADMQIFTK